MTIEEAKSKIRETKVDISATDSNKEKEKLESINRAIDTAVDELDKVKNISEKHEKTKLPPDICKAVKSFKRGDLSSAEGVRDAAIKWVKEWNKQDKGSEKDDGENPDDAEVDPETKSWWRDHVGDIITVVAFTFVIIISSIKGVKVDWDATSGIVTYIIAACSLMGNTIYKLFVEKKRGAVSKNASSQPGVEVKNKYQPNKVRWIISSVIAGIGLVIMLVLACLSVLETMFGSWQSTLIYCFLCVAFIVTICISLIIILFYDKLVEPTANNTEG